MTIATRAPVIMPSMATPNRISNQLDDAAGGRRDERRVALAEHRRDPPVERIEDRLERPRLLDQGDQDRGDEHDPTMPWASVRKNRRSSWPATRRTCQATRRMIGETRSARGQLGRRSIAGR